MNDIGIIHLTGKRGGFAVVDADALPELSKKSWYQTIHGYAATGTYDADSQKTKIIYLHRVVNQTPSHLDTDHANGFKLDNRRRNLRAATTGQNCSNRKHSEGPKSSKFKGVCWNRSSKHWLAYINVNGKRIHLKRFYTELEAAKAYNEAATKHFGEFALLNDLRDAGRGHCGASAGVASLSQ